MEKGVDVACAMLFFLVFAAPALAETRDLILVEDDGVLFHYGSEDSDAGFPFTFDLPAPLSSLDKASLRMVQSDGTANRSIVSASRCAMDQGGSADLYLNGRLLASFYQGDKGRKDRIFKNGDGGRFGQLYCCGCAYEHDLAGLLREKDNELYFNETGSKRLGTSEISSILIKLSYSGRIRALQQGSDVDYRPAIDPLALLAAGRSDVDPRMLPPYIRVGLDEYIDEQDASRYSLSRLASAPTRSRAMARAGIILDRAMSRKQDSALSDEEIGASASFIAFLVDRYGADSILKAASFSSKGSDFSRSLQQSTGKRISTLKEQWIESLLKR